jgi:hypothetical protein
VIANGLDPKDTTIKRFISPNPATCRDGENVEKCERAMQRNTSFAAFPSSMRKEYALELFLRRIWP